MLVTARIVNRSARAVLHVRGFSILASLADLIDDEDVSSTFFSTCCALGERMHSCAFASGVLGILGQGMNSSSTTFGVASGFGF